MKVSLITKMLFIASTPLAAGALVSGIAKRRNGLGTAAIVLAVVLAVLNGAAFKLSSIADQHPVAHIVAGGYANADGTVHAANLARIGEASADDARIMYITVE